jgi:pimeloyl-ACP methyl ester carboxylesterase
MVNYYAPSCAAARSGSALGHPILETPTLLLWGERQRLGVETTHGTEAFVPNLTLRCLPGVSHWVQQEAPEKVNAMLAAWLSDRPVPYADGRGASPSA